MAGAGKLAGGEMDAPVKPEHDGGEKPVPRTSDGAAGAPIRGQDKVRRSLQGPAGRIV